MLEPYCPILVFLILSISMGTMPILMGSLLGPRKPSEAKETPYECGFSAFENARRKFDVRFYLLAILFIIFDLELAFLFPWAVVAKKVGWSAWYAVLIFLGLLTVGFIYEWRKGALEWE